MGGGLIKKLSSSLLPSHLRSQTALRLCASTFRTLHKHCNGGRNDQPLRLSSIFPIDGRDITGKTVLQRRDRLEQIISPEGAGVGSSAGNSPSSKTRRGICC